MRILATMLDIKKQLWSQTYCYYIIEILKPRCLVTNNHAARCMIGPLEYNSLQQ